MATESFEVVLRDLLLNESDSNRLAGTILRRLQNESPSASEMHAFINFLIHAGYRQSVVNILAELFQAQRPVPLLTFSHVLYRSGFRPNHVFLQHLLQANDHQKPAERLPHFYPWETLEPQLKAIRQNTITHLIKTQGDRKQRLLEKLEYLRNNRMIEEEEKLLRDLVQMYPEEQTLLRSHEDFSERWARNVLSRNQRENYDWSDLEIAPKLSPALSSLVTVMAEAMLKVAQKKPDIAYNLAVGLYMMEQYEHAAEVLQYAPVSPAADWLQLEVMWRSRRYVECLDAIATIENRYAEDPETVFGATYYRALTLNGLGQRHVATQLLKSIVHIRPHYRSAHSLLLKWGGSP